MIQLHQLSKNMKFFIFPFILVFLLLCLFITLIPITYAAGQAIPNSTSTNWAGLEATGPVDTFRKSQCAATIPKISTQGNVSIWCGLGGDPAAVKRAQSVVLVQAGVANCLNNNCNSNNCQRGVQCSYMWWQIAPAIGEQPVRFTKGVHPGDVVYFYMQSNLHNDNTDLFSLQNRTTGETHTIRMTSQGATKDGNSINIVGSRSGRVPVTSDGASVECIIERPGLNNSLLKLASFQSTTVTDCDDGQDGQSTMEPITNNPTVTTISMFDKLKGGKAIAVPEPPFAQASGITDSFNVVQPTSTTQATQTSTP